MFCDLIDEYYEPLDIFSKLEDGKKSELSDEELGFICGLIRLRQPKKIVEVGVSAGGTSCVILNCLEKMRLDSKFYSIDLAYTYHFDTSKRCGYQISDAAKYLNNMANHKLVLGKSMAEVLEKEIGDGIDMLILDTVHYMPGELLDFLVCLPFLSQDAVIVLDDLTFAHTGENTNAIATKLLCDLIVADKYFPRNGEGYTKMVGIFLNENTRKYQKDYFFGLLSPWWYELSSKEIEVYRNIIKNHYDKEELLLFDEAVKINFETLKKKKNVKIILKQLCEICCSEKSVLIYGIGQRGTALRSFLKDRVGEIAGFIISDDRNKEKYANIGIPVYHLNEIYSREHKILVAVADPEVRKNLSKRNLIYYDVPNYVFPFIKEYVINLL